MAFSSKMTKLSLFGAVNTPVQNVGPDRFLQRSNLRHGPVWIVIVKLSWTNHEVMQPTVQTTGSSHQTGVEFSKLSEIGASFACRYSNQFPIISRKGHFVMHHSLSRKPWGESKISFYLPTIFVGKFGLVIIQRLHNSVRWNYGEIEEQEQLLLSSLFILLSRFLDYSCALDFPMLLYSTVFLEFISSSDKSNPAWDSPCVGLWRIRLIRFRSS